MAFMTYKEQLLHPNWQKRRLEMLEAANWACSRCESSERTLHVHHKQYFKGRKVWEYSDAELEVLCDRCHSVAHDHKELLAQLLANVDVGYPAEPVVIGLLAGYAYASGNLDEETARRASAVAGPYFIDGMIGLAASMGKPPQLAALIRGGLKSDYLPVRPMLEEWLTAWERAKPTGL